MRKGGVAQQHRRPGTPHVGGDKGVLPEGGGGSRHDVKVRSPKGAQGAGGVGSVSQSQSARQAPRRRQTPDTRHGAKKVVGGRRPHGGPEGGSGCARRGAGAGARTGRGPHWRCAHTRAPPLAATAPVAPPPPGGWRAGKTRTGPCRAQWRQTGLEWLSAETPLWCVDARRAGGGEGGGSAEAGKTVVLPVESGAGRREHESSSVQVPLGNEGCENSCLFPTVRTFMDNSS